VTLKVLEFAFRLVMGLAVLAMCWYGAYWLWPPDLLDIPISSLTLGILLKASGSVLLVPIGLGMLAHMLTAE
jgi:hypothetical protein